MKILLFGGDGFVGKNIDNSLTKCNVFFLKPSQNECNLLELASVKSYIKETKPKIIINAAFIGVNSSLKYSKDYISNNMEIVTNIIRASSLFPSNIKKIIHIGSSLEYDKSNKPIDETHTLCPRNMYGTAKALTTLLSISLAREFNAPLIVLRPFNLYGPHDKKSVVYYVIKNLLKNCEIKTTKGEQKRDYLYCPDFAEVVYRTILNHTKFSNYEIYNIASEKSIELKELFTIIFKNLGHSYTGEYLPYLPNEYWQQIGNSKKIKKIIDMPPLTPLPKGIGETITWVRNSLKS